MLPAYGPADASSLVGYQPLNVKAYFEEMIAQVDAFDREQRDTPAPRQGVAWDGEWANFLMVLPGQTYNYTSWPPNGWRKFVQDHSGAWEKLTNSDEVMGWIGLYEKRLIYLRNVWRSLGGTPTSPEPVEGYREPEPPPGQGVLDKAERALGTIGTIGMLAAAGYLLSQVIKLRGGSASGK